MLQPRVDLIPTGHQLTAGGRAPRLDVVVLQLDPLPSELVKGWRLDLAAVVANIIETVVIGKDEDNVGLLDVASSCDGRLGNLRYKEYSTGDCGAEQHDL